MEKILTFRDLGLTEKTLKPLEKKGFEQPSPIQALTIPALLNGEKDIIGQAQTGTGKTAAFSLPILEKIEKSTGHVQAIILAPTRELAVQVAEEMNSLAHGRKLKIIPVYGGQSLEQQKRQLNKGVDIVVGTPGRVMDLMNRQVLKLNNIDYFILDEADEMLNMGFVEDIEHILTQTNEDKRMLFFSATMPAEILKIAKSHMREHEVLAVKKKELTTNLTEQIYFEVKEKDKFEALCRIIDIELDFYGIVFCRTKNDVNELVGKLQDRGYDVEGLHGDISQNHREVTLRRFKNKNLNILIATDVAARGIDVNDLTHVINYAIPQEAESYVHRIGRTGRAGKQGTAITFITPSEYRKLLQIQRITKTEIKKEQVPRVKDVILAKKTRLFDSVKNIISNGDAESYYDMAKELLTQETTPIEVIAAILKNFYDEELEETNYSDIESVSLDKTGKTRLFIALGKKDKMTPRKLVDLISKKTKVHESKLKGVEVYENFSFVSVPFVEAETIVDIFQKDRKGKKPLIEKAKQSRK